MASSYIWINLTVEKEEREIQSPMNVLKSIEERKS